MEVSRRGGERGGGDVEGWEGEMGGTGRERSNRKCIKY